MVGKVYLVGGGPGAIELYTLKAMECIKNADCIVYDRLIDPRILSYTKSNCEKIYVGKASFQHTLTQDKINQLLVDKAKEHRIVVRLKGGDVYVFGRGGEEALELLANNIEFEVVPGLSSSIAGLCYAGIPITHRGLSSGFEVVTAHHKNNSEREYDYTRFLDDELTYVFMMGLSELENIVKELLLVNKDINTPIALISNATLPSQKAIYSTLGHVVEDFKKSDLVSPMLIVMGKVVSLHTSLDFYSHKPLLNKRVLITSLQSIPSPMYSYFSSNGAYVEQFQLGKIECIDFLVHDFDQRLIVFTSQNGVKAFFEGLKKNHVDFRKLMKARFACIGQKTSQVLNEYGFISDIVGRQANSIEFNVLLKQSILPHESLLIISSKDKNSVQSLTKDDEYLVVYQNVVMNNKIEACDFDLVTFSCASSVFRFKEMNYPVTCALSIGPFTTKAIEACYPEARILESDESSYESMIKKVEANKDVF